MLVLTRKVGERIHIGDGIVVTVVRIQHDKIRLGIDAPEQVAIHREEVYRRVHGDRAAAPSSAVLPEPSPAADGQVVLPE